MRMNLKHPKRSTIIKICGITSLQDAISAVELGADLIGLNLVGGPRKITPATAHQFAAHPVLAGKVVVLLDNWPVPWIESPSMQPAIVGVQFYGPLDRPAMNRLQHHSLQLLLPVQVKNGQSLAAVDAAIVEKSRSITWLLDAHVPGQLGGTGKTFDWSAAKSFARRCSDDGRSRLGVAGGLTPQNVAAAMRELTPHLVDVSSGVEIPGRPGVKSRELMEAFIAAVRCRDQAASGGGEV